jgi:hypothetical protein
LRLPKAAVIAGTALICAGKYPVVSILNVGLGRVVQWTTTDWMHTAVLGPLGGLDDVLWRSLVWAARKPFAFRGLPPLVTMRVDDVAGRGGLWGQTPLYWVQTANQHGFKPWLGLFIYNLTESAIVELRDLVQRGQATAFPHAFGRPPRSADTDFYYYEQAYPWRATEYDEFIYFDHQKRRPWPDDEAARGLAAVDEWYQAHAPLPISPYAVAHWYEMGRNVMAHVREQWHAEFIGKTQDANLPLTIQTSWLKSGPFRRYEQPGTAGPAAVRRGRRPVYYADFINLDGQQFFNCVTEIRDDAGYEWQPDQDVAATVGRGVRQLRRAFDSMALAVLFTHETDYIYKISPDAWADEIAQVAAGIAAYNPIYVTLDEGIRYVRATRTSQLKSAYYDPAAGTVTATFTGFTDIPTHFHLFSESSDKITSSLVEVPVFEGECVVTK